MELLEIQGKGALRLTGDLTQTLTGTFETMECFNEVRAERGDIACTVGLIGSIEYTGLLPVAGELHYGINVEFAQNATFEVQSYVNGVPYSDESMHIRGLGSNKPVTLFWISQLDINPGDVVTLMARNEAGGDMDVLFHRTVFTLKIDG